LDDSGFRYGRQQAFWAVHRLKRELVWIVQVWPLDLSVRGEAGLGCIDVVRSNGYLQISKQISKQVNNRTSAYELSVDSIYAIPSAWKG
jgi:hypothetical protein